MGDPGRARFIFRLCLTGACVFALVLSQNLLLFALSWCSISLSLHQLLQFYRDRPGALLAARKKFLISRLGDSALVGALVLTYREFGTWDFQHIFIAADRFRAAGLEHLPALVSWICALLVFAALLKSAQFPFHSWLPDTMETPTPVSALMHAGIINAGGILIIRLNPLISLSRTALLVLCIFGAVTALFASVVMLTQASVKRCLAFSTVGQMGFMMLECGLGAFHMVAHSLYKAYAFLSSGSVVLAKQKVEKTPTSSASKALALLLAIGITVAAGWSLGTVPLQEPVLIGIFSLALAQMMWSIWSAADRARSIPVSLILGVILALTYFALGRAAGYAVKPIRSEAGWLMLPLLAVFFLVAAMQAKLPELSRTAFGRGFYVHARNGFYINTLANRLTASVWPITVPREEN
jgi:NAD(P)H-quinone oxidoreductase subunit 5